MVLCVSISGASGVGKSYIVNKVKEMAEDGGLKVDTIPSVNRVLAELGIPGRTWYSQYLASSVRTFAQLQHRHAAIEQGYDLLLSDRSLLDVEAYTRLYYEKNKEEEAITSDAMLKVHHLTDLALKADMTAFWDLSFLKSPNPAYPMVEDGLRPTDISQAEMHQAMVDTIQDLNIGNKIYELHVDRDIAALQVYERMRKSLKLS